MRAVNVGLLALLGIALLAGARQAQQWQSASQYRVEIAESLSYLGDDGAIIFHAEGFGNHTLVVTDSAGRVECDYVVSLLKHGEHAAEIRGYGFTEVVCNNSI